EVRVLPHLRVRLQLRAYDGHDELDGGLHQRRIPQRPRRVAQPGALRTNESFSEPRSFPSGIRHVLVNGGCAVEEGESTSARTGRVLRRR
ncbi:MAG TPA: hypothetical protein IAC18_06090, partial [Candidatus Scatomorpha merdipullorum]|nr:hypothetical protein [Candidatus Scatomorpha merdipullorum]